METALKLIKAYYGKEEFTAADWEKIEPSCGYNQIAYACESNEPNINLVKTFWRTVVKGA